MAAKKIKVIGGGLAGPEAALQASAPGSPSRERRPPTPSPPAGPAPPAAPAGHALAVDRELFSARVAARIAAAGSGPAGRITVHREEVTNLDEQDRNTITILASGPLTSPALTAELPPLTCPAPLAFYDPIPPTLDAPP